VDAEGESPTPLVLLPQERHGTALPSSSGSLPFWGPPGPMPGTQRPHPARRTREPLDTARSLGRWRSALFTGRGSDELGADRVRAVVDALVSGLTKRVVLSAASIAGSTQFLGSWDFGVAITRLRGTVSWETFDTFGMWSTPRYSEDNYRETTRATYEEITQEPTRVVSRLLGRFRRAFGTDSLPLPGPIAKSTGS
jgi:hypothetical protein